MKKQPITVAYGDGIGPEIMEATLKILEAAGAALEIELVTVGEKAYLAGIPTGIEEKAWESLRRTKIFLKAPLTTPQGKGYRSVNVTIRTRLGLYANVRPCASYHPFISTKHPKMDLVIVRENEEDLYVGIEYRPTPTVCEATKIITRPGSEKIIRYAFDYARENGRKKVTCFTKDNILKITDGLFHQIFEEIGAHYPEIEKEHWIVDIGAAKLADTPENFDLIVLPNLYGDILSDVAAQITGSVGLGGSANIGDQGAMFEAIHGSAPKYAGLGVANPTGLLMASIMMLVHIQQVEVASRIHNSWLKTIEEGLHTLDIYKEGISRKKVTTQEFCQAIIDRLGALPDTFVPKHYEVSVKKRNATPKSLSVEPISRELVGVDLYLYSHDPLEKLVQKMQDQRTPALQLEKITNRGVEMWPQGFSETFCIELWRCRFKAIAPLSNQAIASLMHRCATAGLDIVKSENLYTLNSLPAFSS